MDEAWYMMQYEDSAQFLRGIVKRGRKYYLGVTTITQDVDDFLKTPYGREIVTNSSIQILLKQHAAAIDQIGEVFYLSEGEKQLLLTADKGQGIFFAGQNHVAIQIISSEDEHNLITSNPEDVLKKQKSEADFIKQNNNEIKQKIPELSKPPIPKVEIKQEIKPKEVVEQRPIEKADNNPISGNLRDIRPTVVNEIKKEEVLLENQHKFEPPKAEVVTMETKKPIFVRNEEVKVPQPPQLNKNPKPIFETNTSPSTSSASPVDKGENKKMDYDDLFGNGIV